LLRRGVAVRVLSCGQQLRTGAVEMEVLHPPPPPHHPPAVGEGREGGNENSRSLVLLVRHAGHSVLLTGDLEGAGLEQVTKLSAPPVDILMAPHHGNKIATAAMIQWARPSIVVSCQGVPRTLAKQDLGDSGPPLLGTWPHGALTIRSHEGALIVETHLSKQRWRLQ
jgi:competence protein ComEC